MPMKSSEGKEDLGSTRNAQSSFTGSQEGKKAGKNAEKEPPTGLFLRPVPGSGRGRWRS